MLLAFLETLQDFHFEIIFWIISRFSTIKKNDCIPILNQDYHFYIISVA